MFARGRLSRLNLVQLQLKGRMRAQVIGHRPKSVTSVSVVGVELNEDISSEISTSGPQTFRGLLGSAAPRALF